jgi:lipopolysaccharide/colanic/teichoic acid biosynthesis glycosyltransferase
MHPKDALTLYSADLSALERTGSAELLSLELQFPLNYVKDLDSFFVEVNRCLAYDGELSCNYFYIRNDRKALIRVSLLGRLCRAGFDILEERLVENRIYLIAKKIDNPNADIPSKGSIIRLKRIGKGGKEFELYKFRTMYPYAEYLQYYIYKNNGLDRQGRFSRDWRITPFGRFLRRSFLDEIPSIANLFKGDVKLVGVRPLSRQYLDLYPEEFQDARQKFKPGLIPPFYADYPKGLDEKIESERRYLESYSRHPFSTDLRCFFLVFHNILFRFLRSQ